MKVPPRIIISVLVTILLVVLLLAVQNAAVVELRFLGWTVTTGLLQLVLLSVAVGALAGALTVLAVLARRRPKT